MTNGSPVPTPDAPADRILPPAYRRTWALVAVLSAAALLRAYHVTAPYVDLSAWRSLDYASMARNFYETSYNILLPRADWAGPAGVIESELPLLPWLVALFYPIVGVQAWLGRLVTLVLGVVGIAYLYALIRRLLGAETALLSALVLALYPLHLYFSRTFQPDVPMMTAMTAALYHFDRYLSGAGYKHGVGAIAAIALAGCFKLSALFVGLPMLALVVARRGWRGLVSPGVWTIGLGGLLPVFLWYAHARQLYLTYGYTVGILSGGHDKLQTLTYLTMPWWWRVMITDRVWRWILTPAGVILFLLGLGTLFRRWKRAREPETRGNVAVVAAWLISGCLFVLIVAEGNLDMPHYQLMVTVPASVVTGLGLWDLLRRLRARHVSPAKALLVTAVALLAGTTWTLRHAYDNKRATEVALGAELNRLTPPGSLFVNPGAYTIHKGGYDYEPMVFYYAHRKGWVLTPEAFTPEGLERYRAQGAAYLATVHTATVARHPDFAGYLRRRFQVLKWDDQGIIVALRPAEDAAHPSK